MDEPMGELVDAIQLNRVDPNDRVCDAIRKVFASTGGRSRVGVTRHPQVGPFPMWTLAIADSTMPAGSA